MTVKILYLTEDSVGSRVHHNLCKSLVDADSQLDVTLFSYERPNYGLRDIRSTYADVNYKAVSSMFAGNMLMYKTIFPYKVSCKYRQLEQSVNVSDFNLTIASTLFSDGAVALRLWKEHRIPYIVVVRGTDVNLYMKKMPHLFAIGRQIVANARKVVFVSPIQYKMTLNSLAFRRILQELKDKSITIANGIDSVWIENRYFGDESRVPDSVLYIGVFDKNKNVLSLIDACRKLRQTYPDLTLNLVGGGGACEQQVLVQVNANQDWIKYHGPIYDKQKLIQICRQNSVFAMISISETFGLVYLEALSQGLPVVYTQNQGFDGLVPDEVGYSVNPKNVADVADKIGLALRNRKQLLSNVQNVDFEQFGWNKKVRQWLETIR